MKINKGFFFLVILFTSTVIISLSFPDLTMLSAVFATPAIYTTQCDFAVFFYKCINNDNNILYQTSIIGNGNNLKPVQFRPSNPPMMDPQQQQFMQMSQQFAMFEQQLAMSNPQQQQFMIASAQQSLIQMLSQTHPQQQATVIQMLQQAMSPQLAQAILFPILSQGDQPMIPQPPQPQMPTQQPNQGIRIPAAPDAMDANGDDKIGRAHV